MATINGTIVVDIDGGSLPIVDINGGNGQVSLPSAEAYEGPSVTLSGSFEAWEDLLAAVQEVVEKLDATREYWEEAEEDDD